MNLGRQIHSLLKRHSAVFVKGLGTFKRIRTSASFDAKRNVVLPPLSYIEFEHEVDNGYDFTLYVQQSNQFDKSQAEAYLKQEVDRLIDLVHQDGQATLEELGQLVAYGHNFIFKPLDLSGFQFVPLNDPYFKGEGENVELPFAIDNLAAVGDNSPVHTSISPPIVNSNVASEASSTAAEFENRPVHTTASEYAAPSEPKRNNGLIYGIIAVLAIIILGGIYYYSILHRNLPNFAQLNAIDSLEHEEDSVIRAVDTAIIGALDTTQIAADDSLANLQEGVTTRVDPIVDHKYAIVIGTHPKFAQAEAEAAEYQRKGYKHVRALPSNLEKNLKKVIWDAYPTKELRDSALQYVQKNIIKGAWPTTLK